MQQRFALFRGTRLPATTMLILVVLGYACTTSAFVGSRAIAPQSIPQHQYRQATHSGTILLDSTVAILVRAGTPEPIQKAAEDLASDFQKVLGKKPRIVSREEEAGPTTILIAEASRLPESMRPAGLNDPE